MPRLKLDADFDKLILCPECGDEHMNFIGTDAVAHGRVDFVMQCFNCEKVNTLYVVNDGTICIVYWAGKDWLRKKQSDVRKHKKTMADLADGKVRL